MKTITISVSTVFITLKCLDILPWSWFFILLPVFIYAIFGLILFGLFNSKEIKDRAEQLKRSEQLKKKQADLQEQLTRLQQEQDNRQSKFREYLDQLPKDNLNSLKAVIILFTVCTLMHSCRSQYGVMKCPKNLSYTYKK